MKIAAGVIGLIVGCISLMYVGLFGGLIGSAAGWLSTIGPQDQNAANVASWADMVKTLSWLAPILLLVGGGLAFSKPKYAAVALSLGAIAHWYLMGLGTIGNLFIFPSIVAAGLAMAAAFQERDAGRAQ